MDNLILKSFIPEIFLSLAILIQLLCNTNLVVNFKYNFPLIEKELFFQIYFILLIVLALLSKIKIEAITANLLFINDLAGSQIKIIFICSSLLLLVVVWQSFSFQNLNFFEFFTLFFFSIFASLILVSCYDLMSAYLVLELQALCFYILAGIKRNSTFSTEAGLKYFIAGSFFSCILLFGISIFYAELGTTNFYLSNLLLSIPLDSNFENIQTMLVLSSFFIVITILFKLAVVPFHFWVPDVYDGSPLSSTIIFSVLPKIVIFTFLIRFLLINPFNIEYLEFLFYLTGSLSIIWGTINALKQKRLKKLFIFSSITQIGLLIIALATLSEDAIMSIYFFLIVYNITSVLSWGSLTSIYAFNKQIAFFKNNKKSSIFLSDLTNLFYTNKFWALAFAFILFSMAGLPPFIGFISKLYVFVSIVNANNISFIAFLMVIITFSTFYYIRILKIIFFEVRTNKTNNLIFQGNFNFATKDFYYTILCFCLFLLVMLFFFPTYLILIAKYITIGFFKI